MESLRIGTSKREIEFVSRSNIEARAGFRLFWFQTLRVNNDEKR